MEGEEVIFKRVKKLEEEVKSLQEQLTNFDKNVREAVKAIDLVITRILLGKPFSAKLTFKGVQGMPATIQVGGSGAQAVFTEFSGLNGTGSIAPDAGPVAFSSDNPAVATVDPNSGAIVAVSVGTANISGTDSVDGLTASDSVTVTAAAPLSATLVVTADPAAAAQAQLAKAQAAVAAAKK
jgi:Bacterial Ig-like domain (group 2)